MGIFDVFKTKVSEAADKVGDVAEQAWDKAGDLAGDMKDKVTDRFDGDKDAEQPTPETDEAAQMVSEGAPVAETGEAAPGAGDEGATGGGMTGTIKDNLAGGVDKAAGMADSATGGKATDQINTGAEKAKDTLG